MMADFGMADYCVAELSEQSLLAALQQLLDNKAALSAAVTAKAADLKQQNAAMWQRLYQSIN